MLATVEKLLPGLEDNDVRYCHWKSNWALERTLRGETDLDLLIERSLSGRFRELMIGLGFEPSVETGVRPLPSTEHYHRLDDASGAIVHIHAYYRVISGESIAKSYRLPIEDMLLASARHEGPIRVPSRGAELVVFAIRMLVKHTTPVELALLMREWRQVRAEAEWLISEESLLEAETLAAQWLPGLDTELLRRGVEVLARPAPLLRRMMVGFQVRAALRSLARRNRLDALVAESWRFAQLMVHRMTGSPRKLSPTNGGAVIAFVGSEATGKTTLLAEAQRWLGVHFTVTRIHAGKPPATLLTFFPHWLLPALRQLLPQQRTTRVEADYAERPSTQPFPVAFGVRSVMLAYERRVLLRRAFARSANGGIVLCDRYPSSRSGSPDSPQLGHLPTGTGAFHRWLAATEARLYRDMPLPDLVVYLTAPLQVTLARNAARTKTEEESFVRWRHSQSNDLEFDGVAVHKIDTDQPPEVTLREVKQVIWEVL
ncbi:MAG: hypothetical protein ACT4OP_13365 [Actinomycetota bacterium]